MTTRQLRNLADQAWDDQKKWLQALCPTILESDLEIYRLGFHRGWSEAVGTANLHSMFRGS